jgi:hypothetical protein
MSGVDLFLGFLFASLWALFILALSRVNFSFQRLWRWGLVRVLHTKSDPAADVGSTKTYKT